MREGEFWVAFSQQNKGMKDPQFLEDNDLSLSLLNPYYHFFKVTWKFPLTSPLTQHPCFG